MISYGEVPVIVHKSSEGPPMTTEIKDYHVLVYGSRSGYQTNRAQIALYDPSGSTAAYIRSMTRACSSNQTTRTAALSVCICRQRCSDPFSTRSATRSRCTSTSRLDAPSCPVHVRLSAKRRRASHRTGRMRHWQRTRHGPVPRRTYARSASCRYPDHRVVVVVTSRQCRAETGECLGPQKGVQHAA